MKKNKNEKLGVRKSVANKKTEHSRLKAKRKSINDIVPFGPISTRKKNR